MHSTTLLRIMEKQGSASALTSVGKGVGGALRAGTKGTKALFKSTGDFGEGIAEAVGMNPYAGRLAGQAAPVAVGGHYAGKTRAGANIPVFGRRWRAKHRIFTPSDYGRYPSDY